MDAIVKALGRIRDLAEKRLRPFGLKNDLINTELNRLSMAVDHAPKDLRKALNVVEAVLLSWRDLPCYTPMQTAQFSFAQDYYKQIQELRAIRMISFAYPDDAERRANKIPRNVRF